MNQTSSYQAQGPQRRERLLDLASLRKKPLQNDVLEPASEVLASEGEAGETNVDPADVE
jgi:hypothetical protein